MVIALTNKHAVGAQASLHKARILYQDVLQADDFFEREFVPTGLENGTSPPF